MSCKFSCRHTALDGWDGQRSSSRPHAVSHEFYHLLEVVCQEAGLLEGAEWRVAPFGHTLAGSVGVPAGWLECSCWSPKEWFDLGRSGPAPRGSRSSLWLWGAVSGPQDLHCGTTSWVPHFLPLAPPSGAGGSRCQNCPLFSGCPGSVLCSALGSVLYEAHGVCDGLLDVGLFPGSHCQPHCWDQPVESCSETGHCLQHAF